MDHSFKIEAKLFIFRRKGENPLCISKKNRKFMKNLYISSDIVLWLAKVVEDSSSISSPYSHYQSKIEYSRVFLAQWGKNRFGNFIKLSKIGNGVSISQLIIPRGQNGGGWLDFVHYVREMVGVLGHCFCP